MKRGRGMGIRMSGRCKSKKDIRLLCVSMRLLAAIQSVQDLSMLYYDSTLVDLHSSFIAKLWRERELV